MNYIISFFNQTIYTKANGNNVIKVGYYETSKVKLENFKKFCESNEINNIKIVPYHLEEGSS